MRSCMSEVDTLYYVTMNKNLLLKIHIPQYNLSLNLLQVLNEFQMEWHQRNLSGNLLQRSSWGHVWSRVNVPPDFLVAKPARQAWVAFPAWTTSRAHNGYCAVIHTVMIMRGDRAKSEGTIPHLHTWQPIWPPLDSVNTRVKKRPDSLHKFPWVTFIGYVHLDCCRQITFF